MENVNFCRALFEETRFINLLIKSTLSGIVAKHGLNPYQAHLLGEIASQDGQTIKELAQAHLLGEIASQDGQTIKELAYHLCVKPSNFKPIVQPMEDRGLIERRQDENDKRSFRIYLTDKGRAESAAIDAEFSALFGENPDAAELQQQVIEGFKAFRKLASLNSELKTTPIDPRTRKEN